MEIQKIQKCMFLNLKLPKFCLKWLIFPRFFLASYSSRGIPRIEIPHSSFLIEGLTSLIVQYVLASKINPHFLPKGLSTYIHYRASKARNWTLPTNKEGPFLMLQCYKIIKKCNFRKSH